jgi:IS30 family transposase
MRYKQLNFEQRYSIEVMLRAKTKKSLIWVSLGISESTFYREVKRNFRSRSYNAKYAQMLSDERKKEGHYKTIFSDKMQKLIIQKLEKDQWSPEQITGWCRLNDIEMVSHERIYQFIWANKSQGGTLYESLRTGQKKYKKRYGSKSSRGQIPDRISIEKRPDIVEQKIRIGDFESDLIIGKDHQGALLTIVDRFSSFLIVENVGSKKADLVTKMTIRALAPHKEWVKTITNDNGKEFAGHKKLADKLDCDVYFAHPYASWERGLNEYTNKLLRQYFPKNETLKNISQHYIFNVVEKLNNRPRKNLGFQTPKQVYYNYIYEKKKLALSC